VFQIVALLRGAKPLFSQKIPLSLLRGAKPLFPPEIPLVAQEASNPIPPYSLSIKISIFVHSCGIWSIQNIPAKIVIIYWKLYANENSQI
jgi:hypothetical protein